MDRVGRPVRLVLVAAVVVGCVSLGFEPSSGGALGSVSRWSGRGSAAASESSVDLESVSCSSRDACTAVGQLFTNAPGTLLDIAVRSAVAERWNGRSWSVQHMQLPSGNEGSNAFTVSCPTDQTCFAVGNFSTERNGVTSALPLVERWARGAWAIQQIPDLPDTLGLVGLDDVACTAANACVAVGGIAGKPLIERWNGIEWSGQPAPAVGPIFPVSCTSRRACLAIGTARTGKGLPVVRWNGSRWRLLRSRLPSRGFLTSTAGGEVSGLSCTSMRACIAVGGWASELCSDTARPTPCSAGNLAWRWNGSRWSMSTALSNDLYGNVSCVSGAWCMATIESSGVHHWDGTRWSTQALPRKITLNDVSCTSEQACVGVGAKDVISRNVGLTGYKPLAARWSGKKWTDAGRFHPG